MQPPIRLSTLLIALLLSQTACGAFKTGTAPDDASADANVVVDMTTSLDMTPTVDMTTPLDASVDAMHGDASASTRSCRDDGLGNVPAFTSSDDAPGCCKVELVYDSDARSIVFPRNETPLPMDDEDPTAYVRVAIPGGSICHSYSIVRPFAASTIDYWISSEARLYMTSFPRSGGVRSECVDSPSPFVPRSETAITIGSSSGCTPEACPPSPRWIATGALLSIVPPDDCEGLECAMLDPNYLIIGWKPWSGMTGMCAASDPSFGGGGETACPSEGEDITALDDIPNCPTL